MFPKNQTEAISGLTKRAGLKWLLERAMHQSMFFLPNKIIHIYIRFEPEHATDNSSSFLIPSCRTNMSPGSIIVNLNTARVWSSMPYQPHSNC